MSFFFLIIHQHFIWIYFVEGDEIMVVPRCQWPHSSCWSRAAQPVSGCQCAQLPVQVGVGVGLGSVLGVRAAYPVGPPER